MLDVINDMFKKLRIEVGVSENVSHKQIEMENIFIKVLNRGLIYMPCKILSIPTV